MPNLYGSTPKLDIQDYRKMFEDADFRPDELKVYPCSLIESAELMQYYQRGDWQPYEYDELLEVLVENFKDTPEYCRLNPCNSRYSEYRHCRRQSIDQFPSDCCPRIRKT